MDAAVVAKPHDFWGEVPILFLLSEHDLNIKSIKAWLGTLLPSEFLPEKIIVLKSFPTSVTGKVMKAKLIEKYLI
jgi:long-chain acyl-CoA synthetase